MYWQRLLCLRVLGAAICLDLLAVAPCSAAIGLIETAPVKGSGDICDDMCVWLHPNDNSRSVIIGTNKADDANAGLYLFDLNGAAHNGANGWVVGVNWFDAGDKVNNVDIRYCFRAGRERWDVVCTSNRTDRTIDVFRVTTTPSGDLLALDQVGKIPIGSGFASGTDAPYGLAMYRSIALAKHYVLASDKRGYVAQFELVWNPDATGTNRVSAIRHDNNGLPWNVSGDGSELEGIAADDERDVVYIGPEDHGIYRYPTINGVLNPAGRVLVEAADMSNSGTRHLAADVEGLALYYASDGTGYLIASSQGENAPSHRYANTFAVYKRGYTADSPNEYVMNFSVGAGPGVDAVTGTDGIDVVNANLGGAFSTGMFLAHDGSGNDPSNFKLVSWADVADDNGHALTIDTTWSPRRDPTAVAGDVDGDGCVNVTDLLIVRNCLGTSGATRADVNADGICNVSDLLLVRNSLGQGICQ